MENLLVNGGFEADWGDEESHKALVITADGEIHERDVGSIFTPPGWMTWYRHAPDEDPLKSWDQPEVRDARREHDPARVHSGDKAVLMFSFYRHHWGGFMQRVQVTPGGRFEFTASGHHWSNHLLAGHEDCYDEPGCSCGVGTGAAYYTEETAPLFVEGEHWSNAIRNACFTLGVDPTGGSDPLSDDVIWGADAYIYNEHAPIPAVVFEAVGPVATVYLRSRTLFPFKHNDAYCDDAKLTSYAAPPPEPEPPFPYESTMLVLPQDATPRQLHEIFTLAYPDRRTFGFSNDDAGNLHGTAILYNIPDGEKQAYLNFYTTRYPGVTVKFTHTSDWEEPPAPPSDGLLLWQCDPRWKNEMIASLGCSLTLCQTGCWISACAMAQRFFGIKPDATPSSANQALGAAGGFSGCLTLWSGMKTALGLEVVKKTLDDSEAREWLDKGYVCFAEVEPAAYMHFVLVTRHEGRFWMHDPYKGVVGWLDDYYPGVESWRLIRPFEPVPPPPPPPPYTELNLIDPHLQTVEPGILVASRVAGRSPLMQKILSLYYTWQYNRVQSLTRQTTFKYVRDAKPNYVKVFSFEDVFGVLRAHPGALVGVRHYTNDYGGIIDVEPALGAKRWVDQFRDALYATCAHINQEFPGVKKPYFLMEGPNELVPSQNAPLVKRALDLDLAICLELERTGLPIASIGYCAGVGNPHESEYHLIVPLARELERTGGALGLHLYWWANQQESGLDSWWKYHAGRYQEVDEVLVANGVHADWLCGESGVVQSDDGYHLNAHSGWKDVMTWERYLTDILEVNRRDNEWNETHGGRMKGRAYFTTCALFCNWLSFRLNQPEFEAIAAALPW